MGGWCNWSAALSEEDSDGEPAYAEGNRLAVELLGMGGGIAAGIAAAVPPSMPWMREDASVDAALAELSKIASNAPCKRPHHSANACNTQQTSRRAGTLAASRTRREGSSPFSGCTAPRYSATASTPQDEELRPPGEVQDIKHVNIRNCSLMRSAWACMARRNSCRPVLATFCAGTESTISPGMWGTSSPAHAP